mmetsp:Transcript_2977/g.3426  ORF Transcript_2977/g.3426 Transcript_2977/m.3426 type:complete len:84 (-) Transcript_2977:521-772(-)
MQGCAFKMKNEHLYRSSFNRPNLAYEVRKQDSKSIDIIYIAKRRNDSSSERRGVATLVSRFATLNSIHPRGSDAITYVELWQN